MQQRQTEFISSCLEFWRRVKTASSALRHQQRRHTDVSEQLIISVLTGDDDAVQMSEVRFVFFPPVLKTQVRGRGLLCSCVSTTAGRMDHVGWDGEGRGGFKEKSERHI